MCFRLSHIPDPLDAISHRRISHLTMMCSPLYLRTRSATILSEMERIRSRLDLSPSESSAILDRLQTADSETQAALLTQSLLSSN